MTKVQCSYIKYSLCLGDGWRQEKGRHKSSRHREEEIMRKAGIYNFFFLCKDTYTLPTTGVCQTLRSVRTGGLGSGIFVWVFPF